MDLLIDLVVLGVVIALEPLPIVSFILCLLSRHGARAGWAFLAGWMLSLIAVTVLAVALTGGTGLKDGSHPSTASYVIQIVLGAVLVVFGLRRRRAAPRDPTNPKLMQRVESMNLWGAVALGILMQPWVLVAAGVNDIVRQHERGLAGVLTVVLFFALSSSVLVVLQLGVVYRPETSAQRLANLRAFLEAHRAQAVVVLALVAGCYLIVKGAVGLA